MSPQLRGDLGIGVVLGDVHLGRHGLHAASRGLRLLDEAGHALRGLPVGGALRGRNRALLLLFSRHTHQLVTLIIRSDSSYTLPNRP
ncbi:MAG TPA: hypothetical protein PKA93_06825, partial [Arachnia sp.]|nr:hypothetical protein [Arachnia sp.]